MSGWWQINFATLQGYKAKPGKAGGMKNNFLPRFMPKASLVKSILILLVVGQSYGILKFPFKSNILGTVQERWS